MNVKNYFQLVASYTWECTAQHLSSQADVPLRPILVPGLWVDPNIACHCGSVEEGEDGCLCILVSFKYLRHKDTFRLTTYNTNTIFLVIKIKNCTVITEEEHIALSLQTMNFNFSLCTLVIF